MLIDSHCHFDFAEFDGQRDILWQSCLQAGISALIMPGVEPSQWQQLADISQQFPGIYYAAGLHPWWVESCELSPEMLQSHLRKWLDQHTDVVAIGECGLDGKLDYPLAKQIPFLDAQLALAREYELPVILHGYKAHQPLLERIKHFGLAKGGVIHGFSGSLELALSYWRLGFRIGVGGTVTYPRANKTRKAVAQLPLEAILLETDAPDMPLQGYQGQANTPLRVADVARCVAELRGESLEQVSEQTSENSRLLFGLLK
ncbi:TatD family hydrolase [Maricurvus nonylphenolicus]|uniref:TatD family hydrolase n=1 Tax=Maricurvus nonylphenolicus TaxID=1008307 RepID=UPI0036F1FCAE